MAEWRDKNGCLCVGLRIEADDVSEKTEPEKTEPEKTEPEKTEPEKTEVNKTRTVTGKK